VIVAIAKRDNQCLSFGDSRFDAFSLSILYRLEKGSEQGKVLGHHVDEVDQRIRIEAQTPSQI
jgi:hypothetical protein